MLPEKLNEPAGEELVSHAAIEPVRIKLQAGIAQLEAGLGEGLNIEDFLQEAHRQRQPGRDSQGQ